MLEDLMKYHAAIQVGIIIWVFVLSLILKDAMPDGSTPITKFCLALWALLTVYCNGAFLGLSIVLRKAKENVE